MLEKLFRAIRRGDDASLSTLLADGADPDQQYSGGDSLLSLCMPHIAPCEDGHLAVLDRLLAAGVSPDSPYRDGTRPIFIWAAAGHEAAVSALIAAGADCTGVDNDGRSLVLCAASGGLHARIAARIRDGAGVDGTDSHGHSALHLAADAWRWSRHTKDSVQTIQVLLEAGAPVDARCTNGTPLHIAAESGRGGDVAILLAAGAEVRARTADSIEPLHLAALAGTAASVAHLLAAGASVSACDAYGWTPLHYAAHGNQPDIVTSLLEAGADPSVKSTARRSIAGSNHGKHKTPANIARRYRRTTLVALLTP